jgi:hypothetical protein
VRREHFCDHHAVNHTKRVYAVTAPDGHLATTNSAEGLFANLKRQIQGTHHHTSERHLPKYLEEHDFKFNTRDESDTWRTEAAIEGIEGQRLTFYRSVDGGPSLVPREPGEPAPPKPDREGAP